jgi:predicted CopG family antitoxin
MGNNTQFKQILIDLDNYNALKELGKTGDSFNDVIGSLLNRFKIEGGKV